jgi:hypothetical protein
MFTAGGGAAFGEPAVLVNLVGEGEAQYTRRLLSGENSTNGSFVACRGDHAYAATSIGRTMQVLTIFIFAFTCQQNIFAICDELVDGTMERVGKVIGKCGAMRESGCYCSPCKCVPR